jgi:hypothetical protein
MSREPILLREKRYNYLPYRFLHRGVEQRVRRVEQSWEIDARWWRNPGRYFRVQCQNGSVYDLFHDVMLNAWFLEQSGVVRSKTKYGDVARKDRLRWTFT